MSPENTIAQSAPQGLANDATNPGSPKGIQIELTPAQRTVVVALLQAERAHACRWWTYLREARLLQQLPDWIEKQTVGRHCDYEEWDADCLATNLVVLGINGNLNGFNANQLIDHSVGVWGDEPAPQNEQVAFRGAHGGEA